MPDLESPRQKGTFAEGECDPEDTHVGTFAEGEEQLVDETA
jgi:hypothetical protein